ncbi:MAG: GNAT family N-acetyltransferase [Sandaracinaceae bacterium]|nr:GNAT family N-acetyltransferase [Sandaracinaceae bacterium]
MTLRIRAARSDEASTLRAIEDEAGARYAEAGLPPDLDGLTPPELAEGIEAGTAWVLADEEDHPVAFALCWRRGDALHLRELDVLPARMGQGLGSRLIEHVVAQAQALGCSQVTLTTFRDVAWNAPYYARRAFRVLEPSEQPAFLRAIREDEDRGVLATWPRVAMARPLGA